MFKKTVITMVILALPSMAGAQNPIKLGIGLSGGLNIPVVQQDQARGTAFGIRGIIGLMSLITIEPNLNFAKYGDPSLDLPGVTNDLEGSKVTSYGVDALLGASMSAPGLSPFVIVGMGFYKTERDQTAAFDDDGTDFGWSAGLGFALGLSPAISLDVRGRFNMIPVDGGSSKKSVFVTGGLNYFFGGN